MPLLKKIMDTYNIKTIFIEERIKSLILLVTFTQKGFQKVLFASCPRHVLKKV